MLNVNLTGKPGATFTRLRNKMLVTFLKKALPDKDVYLVGNINSPIIVIKTDDGGFFRPLVYVKNFYLYFLNSDDAEKELFQIKLEKVPSATELEAFVMHCEQYRASVYTVAYQVGNTLFYLGWGNSKKELILTSSMPKFFFTEKSMIKEKERYEETITETENVGSEE